MRVYGDPAATQFAERADADAVAVGDIVALGAGHTPGVGSPETLGLLAHELTYVARWRAPRFVPPIARTTEHGAGSGREVAAPTNEEGLARLVEARVTRAAEATLTPEHRSPPLPFGAPVAPAAPSIADREPNRYADAEVVRTEADPGQQATGNDMSRAVPAAWNGLPAPWEPLPTWLDAPGPGAPTATPPPAASPATSVFSPQGAAAPAVQLAERGRTPDEATPATATGSAAPPAAQSPEPDLDALARQVYAVLRRRLSAEGRRAW